MTSPVLFFICINDPSDTLKNTVFLFAPDSTLCPAVPRHSARQTAAALSTSLSADLEFIRL